MHLMLEKQGDEDPLWTQPSSALIARTTKLSSDSPLSARPLCMSKAWNIILVTVKSPANSNLLSSFHQITSSSSMSAGCHNFLLSTLNIIHSQLHWRPITHILIFHHEECSNPKQPRGPMVSLSKCCPGAQTPGPHRLPQDLQTPLSFDSAWAM